jgi:GTP-binding protein Era
MRPSRPARASRQANPGGVEQGLPVDHRSGYVAIVGRPNVGKSTLLNRIVGSKIAAVTAKPQTTRRRLLGIKTLPTAQALFVDTPGIHAARDLLNQRMVEQALQSLPDADVVLWVVEAREGPGKADRDLAARLPGASKPVIIALNKIDGRPKESLLPVIAEWAALMPGRDIVPISARTGENVDTLLDIVIAGLPQGPRYYPPDELTDASEREIVAELVREKVMMATREEIPYGVAVTVDSFEEKPEKRLAVITATIHVARASHKPIIVGERGQRIKAIGQGARSACEALLGRRVFLELFVRVQADWPRQPARLREFGL